ncbi:copper amine oxidase N-terminal domain-containing protein, partial [Tyzzerella sp. OttesenSCG-928-J15]|nr:copper amine oxidase N-terminal domain-containing protein [Tyzzerella sp. OttesenSCG-928-J15]
MKKRVVLFAALLMLNSVPVMANDGIKVLVDGQAVVFDVAPSIIEGRTLVPLRAIAESLGAEVAWDGDLGKITLSTDEMVNTLYIDDVNAVKTDAEGNETAITLDVPPMIIDGRTMVPARYIAESMGAEVGWDGDTQTITIVTDSEAAPVAEEPAAEEPKEEVKEEEKKDVNTKVYTYHGSGDDVIKIEHPDDISVLYITGNGEDQHFAVKGYNDDNKFTDLYVNTTDPYEGITLDFESETSTLEISATGAWTIEIRS